MKYEPIEDADDAIEDDDEPGYCPQCNGSGEGMYDGSKCGHCHGSGVERDESNREDWEAERAYQRDEDERLAG